MRIGLTEIIFIVDRSGSMASIRRDMIGGFNTFIKEQQKLPTDCKVSFYQFDKTHDHPIVEKVYEQTPINAVSDLTEATFVPRGGTPLFDAVARVIREVQERYEKNNDDRPEKTLVVCITDGEENESKEWKAEQVKQMIENATGNEKWEFVYLGANQNAWQTGQSLGVSSSSTMGYVASKGGTNDMWKSLSNQTMRYRSADAGVKKEFFSDEDRDKQKSHGYSH